MEATSCSRHRHRTVTATYNPGLPGQQIVTTGAFLLKSELIKQLDAEE